MDILEYARTSDIANDPLVVDLIAEIERLRSIAPANWEWGHRHAQGTNPKRDEAEARRSFEEGVRYDTRRQLTGRGRNAIVRRVPAGEWQVVESQA